MSNEPKVDWQIEYMTLAMNFLEYIATVHKAVPEFTRIARRKMDEMTAERKQREEEELRFLFQRYGIEYNEDNLRTYRDANHDFWGECLDWRDTEDGGCYEPPRPTRTMIYLNSLNWSNLVKGEYEGILEGDLENPDFRLPGDRTESKGGRHHRPEDREDIVMRMREYVKGLEKVKTFVGTLEPLGEDPEPVLKKLGIMETSVRFTSGLGWWVGSDVQKWMKWYENPN